MKKKQTAGPSRGHNCKNANVIPACFPKKQFEFIQREKDNLPTSQAFQSIIFMKNQKCEPKSTRSLRKGYPKAKKPQIEGHKQIVTQVQKQLNDHKKNKVLECNFKTTKNAGNSNTGGKRISNDFNRGQSLHSLEKAEKLKFLSLGSARNGKFALSSTKPNMQKLFENYPQSKKYVKTQETCRKDGKGREKLKENESSFHKSIEPQQFILVGDHFVAINSQQVQAIEERLLSSRDYPKNIRKEQTLKKYEYEVKIPIAQHGQSEEPFGFYSLTVDKTSQLSPLKIYNSGHQIFMESNLKVVQKYIVSKVKSLQKWWRRMLKKKISKNSIKSTSNLENMQLLQNSQIQQSKAYELRDACELREARELREATIDSCVQVKGISEFRNSSPIKLVQEFYGSAAENEVVSSRQNAAKMQLETHISILQTLLTSKKITLDIYLQRKEMVKAKFCSELQQIQELRRFIRRNVDRAVEIQMKMQQDLQVFQKTDVIVSNNLLDQIFGVEFDQCFQDVHQDEERFDNAGSHIYSITQQNAQKAQYDHQNRKAQDCSKQFQGYNQYSYQLRDFYSQKESLASLNHNFKDVFQKLKQREYAKIEIERRVGIQMGILVPEIPQLKGQTQGIDTSLNSIHRFLLDFFKYYIFQNKFDFLRLANMPYGYSTGQRLKALQGYAVEDFQLDDDGAIYGLDTIIPEEMFDQFYEKIQSQRDGTHSSAQMEGYQFEKVHSKALFDCFNEGLNYFRPYFVINGTPYPWNYSQKALNFYFITEENIQQVFQKTQFKVLKWASRLCGLILNNFQTSPPLAAECISHQELVQHYKRANKTLLNETREERLAQNQKAEIVQTQDQWFCTVEEQTYNFLKVVDQIFDEMAGEIAWALLAKGIEGKQIQMGKQKSEKQIKTGLQSFQNVSSNSSLSEFQML